MSALQRLPESDPLYQAPLPGRPHYATGMLLDAQDFIDEQTYHRSRLARALSLSLGSGTLAGLRVSHQAGDDKSPEEIRVSPGVAVDRLGRLIEIPRSACLRLNRWFDEKFIADGGSAFWQASYDNLGDLLGGRAQTELAADIPARGLVADVFVRFIACEQGLTPSFAAGPFDALNAAATARLRDAYELLLLPRLGLTSKNNGLPAGEPDFSSAIDQSQRLAAMQDAVLDAWPAESPDGLALLPEQPITLTDRTAVLLARIVIPVTADNPPQRDGSNVLVDNWSRRFLPPAHLVTRWLSALA